jgi:3-deoxy-D-manno-octulosonate 8-phosphate phosphatase (KDO 8-P phosphatase)
VSVVERLKDIRLLAMDVDGVLTDGTFVWSTSGEESKRFSFEDVMGLSIGRKAGLVFALISGEDSVLIDRFAEKLKIRHVYKGIKSKGEALQGLMEKLDMPAKAVAYIGDDVNDLPAFLVAGVCVAPANAHASVKRAAHLVLDRSGGMGAIRELIDRMLAAREK